MTKKTRKGKTILKPRVPTKLTNNIGKSKAVLPDYPLFRYPRVPFKN